MIGGEVLYNLVIVEIVSIVFKCFDIKLINLDKYWYVLVYCGMVVKSFVMRFNVCGVECFFVMGIL